MSKTGGGTKRSGVTKRGRSGSSEARYAPAESAYGAEAPKRKNLRLHQSKIDEAREILGTATETETIEAALDLVVFRKELTEGVRAMRGTHLVNLFDTDEE